MRKKLFIFLSSLFWFSYTLFCQSAIVLQPEQVTEIRKQLNAMRYEVKTLKTLHKEQLRNSAELQTNCDSLEKKLQTALQLSEISETKVVELKTLVEQLQTQIVDLRTQFNLLNESYVRQKRITTAWKIVAGVAGAIATGSLIWAAGK